jgi:hypothetical protein
VLLALHGLPRSGKDTIASRLPIVTGQEWERRAFGDALKRVCAAALDITLEELEDFKNQGDDAWVEVWEAAVTGHRISILSVRDFIKRLGTEGIRAEDPNFWVDVALKGIQPPASGKNYVIVDCRFANELARVTALDGTIWRVLGGKSTEPDSHESNRTFPDSWCHHIIRNFELEDGYQSLDSQIRDALKGQEGSLRPT